MLVDGGREGSARARCAAAVIAGTSTGRHELSRGACGPLAARMLVDGGREGSARTWCAAAVIADTSIGRHELSRGAFGPVRTGLRIPATECVCGAAGADLVGTAGAVCCYKLPRNTRRQLRTGMRILSGGKSTGGTTLAGSVDNACSVRYDKLPQSTGRPGCTHCIRRQSSLTYSYAISVRSCAAGRIRARHPVIGIVRPVATCAREVRHGAWGGGTCFARQGPVRGGPTVPESVTVV